MNAHIVRLWTSFFLFGEEPLSWALNTRGVKVCDFGPKSQFISETRTMITKNHWYEVIGSRSIRVISNDLEWPWKEGHQGSIFLADVNYVRVVWPRMTKFGTVTQVTKNCVSVRQSRPHPKGTGPSSSKNFGTSYMRAHSMRNNNPTFPWRSNYTWGNFLHGWPRMLTRDLSAVANLLV